MTSAQMFQEFQIHLDKLDTQNVPDVPIEQFLIFANTAVDEYVQAARLAFETTKKVTDDVSTLVKRLYILPILENDRVRFDFNKALKDYPTTIPTSPSYTPVYYIVNGVFESSYKTKKGITRIANFQHDDIDVANEDPFNQSKYANVIPVVVEDQAIFADPNENLILEVFVGTFIVRPAIITKTTPCNLPEQMHKTIVKRAVELALENVESIRQKTFNQ